jgi:hypothetical protein
VSRSLYLTMLWIGYECAMALGRRPLGRLKWVSGPRGAVGWERQLGRGGR